MHVEQQGDTPPPPPRREPEPFYRLGLRDGQTMIVQRLYVGWSLLFGGFDPTKLQHSIAVKAPKELTEYVKTWLGTDRVEPTPQEWQMKGSEAFVQEYHRRLATIRSLADRVVHAASEEWRYGAPVTADSLIALEQIERGLAVALDSREGLTPVERGYYGG